MRPFRHLQFALDSAWQSFWRNAAVSTAAVMSITLIMMLGGTSLVLGHALSQTLDTYKQRVSVLSISVADMTPLPAVYDFEDQLRARPEVLSVRFVTKEEELHRFAADPRNQQLIEQLDGNPVPGKIEVTVRHLADVQSIDAMAVEAIIAGSIPPHHAGSVSAATGRLNGGACFSRFNRGRKSGLPAMLP